MAQAQYLNPQTLRMNLIRTINDFVEQCQRDDALFHSINPASGQRGGADKFTELQGFRRDATKHIQEPLLAAFANGGATKDIAAFLKALPEGLETQAESAGPFLVRLSQELLERLCPDQVALEATSSGSLKRIALHDFKVAAQNISAGEAWSAQYIDQANASGQFDALDADNFERFLSALEAQAAVYLDEDGMDWEWPEVEDKLKAAFSSAMEQVQVETAPHAPAKAIAAPKMQP